MPMGWVELARLAMRWRGKAALGPGRALETWRGEGGVTLPSAPRHACPVSAA